LNREDFEQRLRALWDALADLREFAAEVSKEQLHEKRRIQLMVLHALYIATQACIDLALQAAAAKRLPSGGTYRDAFSALARAGLLDEELASRMAGWASFRNVLAHFYPIVDFDRVFEALQETADLQAFAAWSKDFLDTTCP
jgi:uncharacterized protein YutE (UPF0331/DUF86 family)